MKIILSLLLSVACVGQIVIPNSTLQYQDLFKPKGETRTCVVSNQTYEVVYSDLAGGMVPAIMGPTSMHYDCAVTVYLLHITNLPPNNRVMIGKPFKGTYVPGGCFEDIPVNMVQHALSMTNKPNIFLGSPLGTNPPTFKVFTITNDYSFDANQFTNNWKWSTWGTNAPTWLFDTSTQLGFLQSKTNEVDVTIGGSNVFTLKGSNLNEIGRNTEYMRSPWFFLIGAKTNEWAYPSRFYGFIERFENVEVLWDNTNVFTIYGKSLKELK